jgi:high-affinity iron transporter
MVTSFLLSLREGIEAALIIGIVIGVLKRLDRSHLLPSVWLGVSLAAFLSLILGLGLQQLGLKLEGRGEELFEGVAMLLAAGILTWMIVWMQSQGAQMRQTLEHQAAQASTLGKQALFVLAFIAVFREGVELALFLLATSFTSNGWATPVGALLGLGTAVALGWILINGIRQLNLRRFFQVTNILLIFFAAGLVGLGVHELNEARVIPSIIENVYDINFILSDKSELGLLLKSLLGYNGNPSLTEIIAYSGYFAIMAASHVRFLRRLRPQAWVTGTPRV